MKLNYTLFGIEISIEMRSSYSICVSSRHNVDPHGTQAWTTSATYLGAIFTGWRLARRYAEMEGQDNHYVIYRGLEPKQGEVPMRMRTIKVIKTVAFFSK